MLAPCMIFGPNGAFSLAAVLAWLGFCGLAVIGPGLAVQRLLRLRLDLALVLPIGLAACAGAYWLGAWSSLPYLFPVLSLALDLSLLAPLGAWSRADGPGLRGALPPFVALLGLLVITEYPQNRFIAGGAFAGDRWTLEDSTFHAGLAWELSHSYPPQVPGLSSFHVSYHLGLPLVRAAALRWAGVHPYDSLNRYDPTLIGLALVLVLRGAARVVTARTLAATLAGWAPLATNLSWLFFSRRPQRWLEIGDVSLSNSAAPALAIALAVVIALRRQTSGEGRGWLIVAAGLSLAVPFFKVFMGAQLVLAFALAAALSRSWRPFALSGLVVSLGTTVLALGAGGGRWTVGLDPLLAVRGFARYVGAARPAGPLLVAWAGVWVAAIAGLRLLGVPAAARGVASRSPATATLASLALSGWLIGLSFSITLAEAASGHRPVNEADYFIDQSGLVLWVFVAATLAERSMTTFREVAVGVLCGALAFGGTVYRIASRSLEPALPRMPQGVATAMSVLAEKTSPGEVVLESPRTRSYPPPPLVLIGRRLPLARTISYLTQFARRDEIEARETMVERFFQTRDSGEAQALARALGARYLCLFENDTVQFPVTPSLELIFMEGGTRVYQISGGTEGP
jgi:hypothetical protein